MMNTQKIIALGFSYYDGSKDRAKLSNDEYEQSIRLQALKAAFQNGFDWKLCVLRELPSLAEFCGYFFNFQTILVGPLSFFNDYRDFISGKNLVANQVSPFFWVVSPKLFSINSIILERADSTTANIWYNRIIKYFLKPMYMVSLSNRKIYKRLCWQRSYWHVAC